MPRAQSWLVLPLLALASAPVWAAEEGAPLRQEARWGLGLGVANRTGLGVSGKYFFDETSSAQAVLAVRDLGWQEGEAVSLSVDYLFEMPAFYEDPAVELAWAWGGGIFGGFASGELANGSSYTDVGAGASAVVAFEVLIRPSPVDFVLEYRPSISVLPSLGIDLVAFGGHVRYYF